MSVASPGPADVKVSVATITYNHEAFIAQAIESVLMQQTDFAVELVIGEDCSTDGTRTIVRAYGERYPERIRLLLPERNQGAQANSAAVLKACRGQYIAALEGDDYWTDPYKLQKQVDFMEAYPEYTLCCGAYESLNENTGERNTINLYDRIKHGAYRESGRDGASFGLAEMENSWLVTTHTILFRQDALQEYNTKEYRYARDIHLYYHIVKAGKAFYFNEVFGVYRIHAGGLHSANHGRVNTNITYQCRRELYEKNGDEFTRRMYLGNVLRLFRYDLFHVYEENTAKRKFGLLLEALRLIRRRSEYVWLLRPFLPSRVRQWLIASYNR